MYEMKNPIDENGIPVHFLTRFNCFLKKSFLLIIRIYLSLLSARRFAEEDIKIGANQPASCHSYRWIRFLPYVIDKVLLVLPMHAIR